VPRIVRTADITWRGNVARGEGKLSGGSGAIELLPFTLASRIGNAEGKTSPEELIAGAVGTCFTMSLATELTQAGTPPELLSTNATCVMDEVDGRHLVVEVQLDARGRVPGVDAETFQRIAAEAEAGCPMAHLVKGTATVSMTATLDEEG
jgi:osmotically inducible protein OsmC